MGYLKKLQVNTCLHFLDDVISIRDCATSEGTYLIFVRCRAVGRSENMREEWGLAIQEISKEKVLLLFEPKCGRAQFSKGWTKVVFQK